MIIVNRLYPGLRKHHPTPRLISLRPLVEKEIIFARETGIRRFYLPCLTEGESEEFFKEFDTFWDRVVKSFAPDHVFWRNVVSTKMQEWESSAVYLALVLFALERKLASQSHSIVIICSSLQEEALCEQWGKKAGWKVCRQPYPVLPGWCRRIKQEVRNLKNFSRMFCICLYRKWLSSKRKQLRIPRRNDKILLISLFYKSSFNNGTYFDPFFGSLHEIIKEKGKGVVYLASPLEDYSASIKKASEWSDGTIIVPYSLIGWGELISLAIKLFTRRVRLLRSDFCGCDFSKLIMWNARRFEYFFNFHSEIYYKAVTNLCKKEQFERLIQLYEGNPFETGCIQAFRKYSSSAIIGYSHAVVFPLNLKIRLSENEKKQKPRPDFLVATGSETKDLMVKIGKWERSTIYPGCSLRYLPVINERQRQHATQSTILVALDGAGASVNVLDWLFEHADFIRSYTVTLRGHPNVPLEGLLAQCIHELPDNFRLSHNDLKTDIDNSFCVIYRQTSVGMQALMNGVPVIHLSLDAPLPCDPILDLKVSKWLARTPEELSAALQEIFSSGENRQREAAITIRKYTEEYFTVPNERNTAMFYGELAG